MKNKKFYKLSIYMSSSIHLSESEFKLKIFEYKIVKDNLKTLNLLDKVRSFRKNKSEINEIQTDFKNNTYDFLNFYCFCYEKDVEKMTKTLKKHIKEKIKSNDVLHQKVKKALRGELNIIHVI